MMNILVCNDDGYLAEGIADARIGFSRVIASAKANAGSLHSMEA